jgi:competence protein ComEA
LKPDRALRRAGGWLERHRTPVYLTLIIVILVGAVVLVNRLASLPDSTGIVIRTPSPELLVYVEGEVVNPGVCRLTDGDLVADAIEAAGGFTTSADHGSLNLAAPLRDGDQVHVYGVGEAPQKVNLNTADPWLLELLPGIGEVLARRIVDYREDNGGFGQIEDLTMVEGIGPATLETLRDKITVR